jgi:hypothetical protein
MIRRMIAKFGQHRPKSRLPSRSVWGEGRQAIPFVKKGFVKCLDMHFNTTTPPGQAKNDPSLKLPGMVINGLAVDKPLPVPIIGRKR